MTKIVLSIITPYYKTLDYTKKLARRLIPQLTSEVEWIIVDDGTHEHELDLLGAKIIHLDQNSGNASKPRNIGLDVAKGDFVAFIDSDDMVSNHYVKTILNKIKSEVFDYCYISWKVQTWPNAYIITDEPPEWNACVWNCIYSKKIIGNNRFDESKEIGEDIDFNRKVKMGQKANILEVLYYYNWLRYDSISFKYNLPNK